MSGEELIKTILTQAVTKPTHNPQHALSSSRQDQVSQYTLLGSILRLSLISLLAGTTYSLLAMNICSVINKELYYICTAIFGGQHDWSPVFLKSIITD